MGCQALAARTHVQAAACAVCGSLTGLQPWLAVTNVAPHLLLVTLPLMGQLPRALLALLPQALLALLPHTFAEPGRLRCCRCGREGPHLLPGMPRGLAVFLSLPKDVSSITGCLPASGLTCFDNSTLLLLTIFLRTLPIASPNIWLAM